MKLEAKNILVCGLARSGVSSAISDSRDLEKININIESLKNMGINFYLGKNPDDILKNFDLIVISPGIPLEVPFVIKAKSMGIPVWSEVELAYRVCPCKIVGITGTNGKSTTTSLVGELLATKNDAYTLGNIGVPFTEKVCEMSKNSVVALELSSFQLESCQSLKPSVAVVLNMTPDHLNRHKTMENYISMKERIFKNQDENDFTVLNYDNDITKDMAKKTKGKVVFFSTKELEEGVFVKENGDIKVKLFGINEVVTNLNKVKGIAENILASIAVAVCENIEIQKIKETIEKFETLEHRLEFVTNLNDIEVYNDSKATNPESAIKALEIMTKPIILIGGGQKKDANYTEFVKTIKQKAKYFICIGESSEEIIQLCKVNNFLNYEKVDSLKDAVEIAYNKAEKGDCILLSPACPSYDMFDNFEQRGVFFKEFVRGVANLYDKK
jgi:UDP-N-acetylmuramoylalanine--D-glutamate ligase